MTLPPVVGYDWVAERVDGLVLADVRWYLDGRSGRAAYEAGRIPGAVFVDLDSVLAATPTPQDGRHPLPDPTDFARALEAAGIGDDDTVVAYDDAGGASAARLVWLLRAVGADAALLDGGLAAWEAPLATGPPATPRAPTERTVRDWPAERFMDADAVAHRRADVVLVDARARERFEGLAEPVDPRAGHIPGAVNVPFATNLAGDGCWRSPAEPREIYGAAGVQASTDVVVYCGSGVTACHDLLALERSGLGPGRLYPGGWSQWCTQPGRPMKQ